MPKPAKPRWHPRNRCWCSDVGPPKEAGGRATTVYFPREIGEHDKPQVANIPKAAWDYLAAYQHARRAAEVSAADPTVYGLCQLFLQWAESEAEAGRIVDKQDRNHCTHLPHFWEFTPEGGETYGARKASSLGATDLELFAQAKGAEGYSEQYVVNLCSSVQAAFNWASKAVPGRPAKILPENTLKGYRPPKPAKVERYMAPASMRAFLRWAWGRARQSRGLQGRFDLVYVRMLWFLVLTGARPGEACNLTWSGVKWDKGIAVLTEWKNKKKKRVDREIHLTDAVARLLRRIERMEGRHPDRIFTHRLARGQVGTAAPTEGAPWTPNSVAHKLRLWREEAKAAGLDVPTEGASRLVAYLARHSYISDGLMRGITESELAELAGTSAEMIRGTYGHIQREHSAKKARELAEKMRGAGGAS